MFTNHSWTRHLALCTMHLLYVCTCVYIEKSYRASIIQKEGAVTTVQQETWDLAVATGSWKWHHNDSLCSNQLAQPVWRGHFDRPRSKWSTDFKAEKRRKKKPWTASRTSKTCESRIQVRVGRVNKCKNKNMIAFKCFKPSQLLPGNRLL